MNLSDGISKRKRRGKNERKKRKRTCKNRRKRKG